MYLKALYFVAILAIYAALVISRYHAGEHKTAILLAVVFGATAGRLLDWIVQSLLL